MKKWGFTKKNEPKWPETEDGEIVPPAFLTHIDGGPVDMELTLNLLTAYNIPVVCEYPNNGLFGKLLFGYPSGGTDVFVPESMLEDARGILSAEVCDTFS